MSVEQAVLKCLMKVTGIQSEELGEIRDYDLYQDGILDSLAIVTMLSMLEKELNCVLETGDFQGTDFATIEKIIAAVDKNKRNKS